jgi:hypothetical protein
MALIMGTHLLSRVAKGTLRKCEPFQGFIVVYRRKAKLCEKCRKRASYVFSLRKIGAENGEITEFFKAPVVGKWKVRFPYFRTSRTRLENCHL